MTTEKKLKSSTLADLEWIHAFFLESYKNGSRNMSVTALRRLWLSTSTPLAQPKAFLEKTSKIIIEDTQKKRQICHFLNAPIYYEWDDQVVFRRNQQTLYYRNRVSNFKQE